MISANIIFIFLAAIAYIGFIFSALFSKLKVTRVLPLMLIGLVIGPILGLINTGPSSTIAALAPYISALAVAFVLFDVGISLKFNQLGSILGRATLYMLICSATTGIAIGYIVHYLLGWSIIYSMIFGFAVSGPGGIIAPEIAKNIKASNKLKSFLLYEGATSDIVQLTIPLILITILLSTSKITATYIESDIFTLIVGSILLGIVLAFFWLYLLNRFSKYSRGYNWMLTLSMVLATYGISEQLGLNGAITAFMFGIMFANIGTLSGMSKTDHLYFMQKYMNVPKVVKHVRSYQREIVFFVSAFYFVYMGLVFTSSGVAINLLAIAAMLSSLAVVLRFVFTPIISSYFNPTPVGRVMDRVAVGFNVGRGISPAIIASILVAYGLNIPFFIDMTFLLVLFSNIFSSVGIYFAYRRAPSLSPPQPVGAR